MDANSVSGHDHCWSSKIEWHVRNPWDWEGVGFYGGQTAGGAQERYERIPVAEWAGASDPESFIGREFFRGSIDPVTTCVPDSGSSGIVASGLGGVMSQGQIDKSCAGAHKLQYPLMVGKSHAEEGSVKREENGIRGYWVEASGTTTNDGSHCFVDSDYNPSSQSQSQRNMLLGLAGVSGNYHGLHRNNDVINVKDVHGDNSLTCLKLGKRQYFEDSINAKLQLPVSIVAPNSAIIKKPRALPSSSTQPPRCQVEGCNVALTNAKEYHRRHKVCEMHSKSPQVIVLGLEQRFCQQCSRFHVISEFDDAKRSCRRRLAGHNERRRKNSSDALASNNTSQEEKRLMGVMGERFPYSRFALPCMSSSTSGRALSLLSSQQTWANSSSACGDLSSRSSAALRELIAENRAQGVSFSERVLISAHCDEPHKGTSGIRLVQQQQQQQQLQQEAVGNSRFMPGLRSLENHIAAKAGVDEDQASKKHGGILGNTVVRPTLDLLQHSNSLFALQTGRNRSSSSSSSSEEECEIWKSFEGTHI